MKARLGAESGGNWKGVKCQVGFTNRPDLWPAGVPAESRVQGKTVDNMKKIIINPENAGRTGTEADAREAGGGRKASAMEAVDHESNGKTGEIGILAKFGKESRGPGRVGGMGGGEALTKLRQK